MESATALALCLFALTTRPLCAVTADYLPYEKFIAEVEAGAIKSATLDQFSQIEGVHMVDGQERPFSSYGSMGSANDVLLNRLLKEKNVAVSLKDQADRHESFGGMLSGLIILAVPLATLLVVLRMNSKLNRMRAAETTVESRNLL